MRIKYVQEKESEFYFSASSLKSVRVTFKNPFIMVKKSAIIYISVMLHLCSLATNVYVTNPIPVSTICCFIIIHLTLFVPYFHTGNHCYACNSGDSYTSMKKSVFSCKKLEAPTSYLQNIPYNCTAVHIDHNLM